MFEEIDRRGTYAVKTDLVKTKFGTVDILPLWVADMDISSPKCVQEALKNRALHPIYGYTVYPPHYFQVIKEWFKRYQWEIEEAWIVPCYGVVPSLNFAISAYSKEGDSVIVQTPLYPPFVSSLKHKKREVLDNTLLYEEGKYIIDFKDFEIKAKKATLFLLCSPHNPSSRAWSQKELKKIIDICLENEVLIISDEIHADIVYDTIYRSLGSFKEIEDKCIIFNAPSKTFNIAGLNTSYAIIPNTKLRKLFVLEQNKSGIMNGNPFGIEALIASYSKGSQWLVSLKIHLQKNINYVNQFLEKNNLPIKAIKTEATFLIWLDCKGLSFSQEELKYFFYHKAKLGLNDGISFGKSGKGFMRLNIGTSHEVVKEAMDRLLKAFENSQTIRN